MSRALKDGVRSLKQWVTTSTSRATRIVKGEGEAGTRAAPARTPANDSKIGVRLDNGEIVTKDGKQYKRYKLQANKNASNSTIKELANKNSHRVFAEADIPLDESIPFDERLSSFWQDLEEDLDKKMNG